MSTSVDNGHSYLAPDISFISARPDRVLVPNFRSPMVIASYLHAPINTLPHLPGMQAYCILESLVTHTHTRLKCGCKGLLRQVHS